MAEYHGGKFPPGEPFLERFGIVNVTFTVEDYLPRRLALQTVGRHQPSKLTKVGPEKIAKSTKRSRTQSTDSRHDLLPPPHQHFFMSN